MSRISFRFSGIVLLILLYLWRWAQYVQATRNAEDFRFAKFLLESGLAERWGGKDSIEKAFGSAPIE